VAIRNRKTEHEEPAYVQEWVGARVRWSRGLTVGTSGLVIRAFAPNEAGGLQVYLRILTEAGFITVLPEQCVSKEEKGGE
jgi:hypothetical protein